jgi:tetratricopeptide (TPR) repeat protein
MAIQNSELQRSGRTLDLVVLGLLLCLGGLLVPAATLEQTEQRWLQAKTALEAKPDDVELNWRFAAACFNRAEFSHQSSERARLAEQGIAAARESIRRDSNSVQGRYYLAVNLGQLARTRTLSALGIVSEMEKQFLAAIAIDPKFRYAAPVRSLGMLYQDAPGWPASVGSRSKARVQLQKAVELAPDYPENWLTLMEAQLKWGEKKKVQTQLAGIEAKLEQAKSAWIAEEGEASWKALLERVDKVRAQAAASSPPAQGSAKR